MGQHRARIAPEREHGARDVRVNARNEEPVLWLQLGERVLPMRHRRIEVVRPIGELAAHGLVITSRLLGNLRRIELLGAIQRGAHQTGPERLAEHARVPGLHAAQKRPEVRHQDVVRHAEPKHHARELPLLELELLDEPLLADLAVDPANGALIAHLLDALIEQHPVEHRVTEADVLDRHRGHAGPIGRREDELGEPERLGDLAEPEQNLCQ